jgi:hypothetical protein
MAFKRSAVRFRLAPPNAKAGDRVAKRREAAKAQLRAGNDPSQQKRIARITKAVSRANTFGVIADELMTKKEAEGRAPATMEKARWLIDLARPTLGTRPIIEISAAEILADAPQGRGARPARNR